MERLVFRIDEIPPEGIEFELLPDPALYGIEAEKVLFPPGVRGNVRIDRERRDIIVTGRVEASLGVTCGRCLGPATVATGGDFDYRLVPLAKAPVAEETELTPGELEMDFLEGDSVDIRRIIAEQIYLNVPLKVVCREECLGLCPKCGQDLNVKDCGHRVETGDARWEVLRKLKTQPDQE
jgi:uncharacterized protein